MTQPYSENDLVRFLYHETSRSENHGIAFQLEDDGSYNEAFNELLVAKQILNNLDLITPSVAVLNTILEKSRNRDPLAV